MVWILKDMVGELTDPKMKDNLNWMVIALRFGSGVALLIPAIYCARESARPWRNESKHRRISLELAAIEPYLSQMDEVDRKKAYSEKVNDYFVGHSDQIDPDDKDSLRNLNLNVNQFLKLAGKITNLKAKIGIDAPE